MANATNAVTSNLPLNTTHKDFWGFPYEQNLSNPFSQYLYDTYYGKGVQINILIPSILYFTLMWGSYFGNSLIIIATISNKNLHGSYNYLISLAGLGDMMHQSCHWALFINMVSGQNFIPYNYCFFIQAFFLNGATISIMMTFFVGIDRLIGVSMPTTYRQLNYALYFSVIGTITGALCAYTLYLAWMHVYTPYGGEPVMCVIIDALGGEAQTFWFDLCITVNFLSVVIYTIVWITLKFKTGTSDAMKKVFKSLLVMMCFVFFGWMMNAFVRSILLPYCGIPVSQWFYYSDYFGLCANIASTSNIFILYTFSAEYRATFEKLLPFLARKKSGKFNSEPSKISPVPSKTAF